MVQLLLAAVLGGAIGLERESRHRLSGLRTNLFICFGSAMFTILSAKLAVNLREINAHRGADYSRYRLYRRRFDHPCSFGDYGLNLCGNAVCGCLDRNGVRGGALFPSDFCDCHDSALPGGAWRRRRALHF